MKDEVLMEQLTNQRARGTAASPADQKPVLPRLSITTCRDLTYPSHVELDRSPKRRRLSASGQYLCSPITSASSETDSVHRLSPSLRSQDASLSPQDQASEQDADLLCVDSAKEEAERLSPWVLSPQPSNLLDDGERSAEQSAISGDMCFGMLHFPLKTTSREVRASAPHRVVVKGRRVCSASNDSKVLGNLHHPMQDVVGELCQHHALKLQLMFLHVKKRAIDSEMLAIIYGPREYANDIADYLDSWHLFLQNPRFCDRNVWYENPQSFAPRGFMTQSLRALASTVVKSGNDLVDPLSELESGLQLSETPTPAALKTNLLKHQRQALTFMLMRESARPRPSYDLWETNEDDTFYRNIISGETTDCEPFDFRGGILADQMGLGKSLSTIALIASDKDNGIQGPTLIVVRAALLKTWEHELSKHTHTEALKWRLHHGQDKIKTTTQLLDLNVVLSTYHTLMVEWKKHQIHPQIMFLNSWRRVVLDEAHDIRDDKSMIARAIHDLQADARWALTGTPIQNRLSDLASLFKFLQIFPYDDPKSFSSKIAALIRKHGIEKARDLLKLIMLRRSTSIIQLPNRKAFDVRLKFSKDEQELYDKWKARTKEAMNGVDKLHVFSMIHKLLTICILGTKAKRFTDNDQTGWSTAIAQAHFEAMTTAAVAVCHHCHVDVSTSAGELLDTVPGRDTRPHLARCRTLSCGTCLTTRRSCCAHTPPCELLSVTTIGTKSSNAQFFDGADEPGCSTKVTALIQDLKECQHDEKCVVFSLWTSTLDMIEHQLNANGMAFLRVDGSVGPKTREKNLKGFRSNTEIRILLLTISCGAVGLDLTAASRAYLMEPHWNPSAEQQALARVHRMGQSKDVTTIRYIMDSSFEEHVLNIQRKKRELSTLMMPANPNADSMSRLDGMEAYL